MTLGICFGLDGLSYILCKIHGLFNSVIPVLIALGMVYFIWGVVQYFIGSDEEARGKGKNRIFFGLIGLTVIVGLWGLVYIIVNTFDLNNRSNYAPTPDELRDLLPQDYPPLGNPLSNPLFEFEEIPSFEDKTKPQV